jgi:hypothetical protein
MGEADQPTETGRESRSAASGVSKAISKTSDAEIRQSDNKSKITDPVSIRVIDDGMLKPFEEQSLVIARDTFALSRRAYWVAIFGFLTALGAAIFVGTQVQIMSYQTQIMGSQSESAAGGAAIGEMNIRKQLTIAQQQARAAQDSAVAIQRQTRTAERAWMTIGFETQPPIVEGKPATTRVHFVNEGRTPARAVFEDAVVEIVRNGDSPTFNYTWDHMRQTMGIVVPSAAGGTTLTAYSFGRKVTPTGEPIPLAITNDEYQKFLSGSIYFAIYAKATYKDIFGVEHWTHGCYWISRAQYTSARKCSDYNDVDNN